MDLNDQRTTLERSGDWVRGKSWRSKNESFKLRSENTTSRFVVKGALGLGAIILGAYAVYHVVNSGENIISRYADKIVEQYVVDGDK